MTCPGCHSFELSVTAHCDGCGRQLSVAEEVALRTQMPAPRTRGYQADREDFAQREAA
jgi:hypothetical protein